MRIEELKQSVSLSIAASIDKTKTKLPIAAFLIEGMSGNTYKRFINTLLSQSSTKKYLEIGVWKGSTSVAAAYGNPDVQCWFIDNFSEFGGPRDQYISNFTKVVGHPPNLIDSDCFGIDPSSHGIDDVDVYFYDGAHLESDHYKALTHYVKHMKESFIYIVDDWGCAQCEPVKKGTYRAIKDLNLKIEQEFNLGQGLSDDSDGWWNGCGVFVLSKPE